MKAPVPDARAIFGVSRRSSQLAVATLRCTWIPGTLCILLLRRGALECGKRDDAVRCCSGGRYDGLLKRLWPAPAAAFAPPPAAVGLTLNVKLLLPFMGPPRYQSLFPVSQVTCWRLTAHLLFPQSSIHTLSLTFPGDIFCCTLLHGR